MSSSKVNRITALLAIDRFLAANAAGGICWATGLTVAIYYLGEVADKWFSRFSWIALVVAVLFGLGVGLIIRRRTNKAAEAHHAGTTEASRR